MKSNRVNIIVSERLFDVKESTGIIQGATIAVEFSTSNAGRVKNSIPDENIGNSEAQKQHAKSFQTIHYYETYLF